MQYKTGKLTDKIKPYRKPRLTYSNCAIDVSKQAQLYGIWAVKQGLKAVHVFPAGRINTNTSIVRTSLAQRGLKLIDVNPEEWKCG